jgi:hypothetical protein
MVVRLAGIELASESRKIDARKLQTNLLPATSSDVNR